MLKVNRTFVANFTFVECMADEIIPKIEEDSRAAMIVIILRKDHADKWKYFARDCHCYLHPAWTV